MHVHNLNIDVPLRPAPRGGIRVDGIHLALSNSFPSYPSYQSCPVLPELSYSAGVALFGRCVPFSYVPTSLVSQLVFALLVRENLTYGIASGFLESRIPKIIT